MTSSLASPFAVENADTVSCTRRERSEVSPVVLREGLYCLDSELCNSGAIRGAVDSLLGGSGGPGEAGDEAALILAASTEVTSVLRQRKISLSYLCCLFYISVILVLYPNV